MIPAVQFSVDYQAAHRARQIIFTNAVTLNNKIKRNITTAGNIAIFINIPLIPQIGATILLITSHRIAAKIKAHSITASPGSRYSAINDNLVIVAISHQYATSVLAISRHSNSLIHSNSITHAINADTGTTCATRQQISTASTFSSIRCLKNIVIGAINMEAYPQRSSIFLAKLISRASCITGKISLRIFEWIAIRTISIRIDGTPKEITPVNIVADILHNRQFSFHKGSIRTIVMMTHQAAGKVYMRKIRTSIFPA